MHKVRKILERIHEFSPFPAFGGHRYGITTLGVHHVTASTMSIIEIKVPKVLTISIHQQRILQFSVYNNSTQNIMITKLPYTTKVNESKYEYVGVHKLKHFTTCFDSQI